HLSLFLFHAPAPTASATLSLHDALPISIRRNWRTWASWTAAPSVCLTKTASSRARATRAKTAMRFRCPAPPPSASGTCCCRTRRSEEHTSELQSRENLVCRLLLEKKKKK